MMMKRRPADIFNWFLKSVDRAPCWERGEECEVAVDVVVK